MTSHQGTEFLVFRRLVESSQCHSQDFPVSLLIEAGDGDISSQAIKTPLISLDIRWIPKNMILKLQTSRSISMTTARCPVFSRHGDEVCYHELVLTTKEFMRGVAQPQRDQHHCGCPQTCWQWLLYGFVWKCWVYSQWNSHLIGIMISKTIGFRGVHYFQTHPYIVNQS